MPPATRDQNGRYSPASRGHAHLRRLRVGLL